MHDHPNRRLLPSTAIARRGLGVLPVLAVFAIAVTICALWTKSSLAEHRDQLLREDRAQTVWLAEAGARRGARAPRVGRRFRRRIMGNRRRRDRSRIACSR